MLAGLAELCSTMLTLHIVRLPADNRSGESWIKICRKLKMTNKALVRTPR